MYRCPRCNNELPANARFCTNCGFNQTNARMTAVSSQQAKQGQPSPASLSAPGQAGRNPFASPPGTPDIVRPVRPAPKGTSNPSIPVRPSVKMRTPASQQPPYSQQPTPMAFVPEPPAQPRKAPSTASGTKPPAQKAGPPQQMPPPQQGQYGQQGIQPQALQPLAFQPATPTTAPTSSPQQRRNDQPFAAQSGKTGQSWQTRQANREGQAGTPLQSPPPSTPFHSGNAARPQVPGTGMGRGPAVQNQPYVPQTPPATYSSAESLAATSQAAERWRKSWLDRQRAEAGPAVGVARGQAVVPEPLLAMQQSLARMRAIVLNQNKKEQNQGMGFSFWFAVVMMLCLVVGLGTYIISTYIPNGQLQNRIVPNSDGPIPLLTLQNKQSTITVGQSLHVHGDHFGAHDPIAFYLNTTQLQATQGTVESSSSGSFDAALTIATSTLAGSYVLEAVDNQAGKHAFVNVQVLPTTISANTTALAILSKQGKALTSLTFGAQVGKGSPPQHDIVLHNTNNTTALPWTATTITDDGVNWLIINDARTEGQLDRSGSDTISISVLTTGLKIGPYTGHIVFTVNNDQQVFLPVTLQMADTNNELIISPNPLIGIIQAGGTCLPDTTLTLINLSSSGINWYVKGDGTFDQQHIQLDGQVEESSTVLPGDTKVIKISCIGVQLGMTYHITIYYNGLADHIPVSIRTA